MLVVDGSGSKATACLQPPPDHRRDSDVEGPNKLAALAYIAILGGFVYLAATMGA